MKSLPTIAAILSLCSVVVLSTPAHAGNPLVCTSLQDCVDNNVPLTVQNCVNENASCQVSNVDALAITAGVLANRVITTSGCGAKTYRSVKACNNCYTDAEQPLKQRFDGPLFHGLLFNANLIVEKQRTTRCVPIGGLVK